MDYPEALSILDLLHQNLGEAGCGHLYFLTSFPCDSGTQVDLGYPLGSLL